MPKQTFYNLTEDKRAVIEDAALNEFAEYGYDIASINRIVVNSKIAKGSFYQYFEDKKDLFMYLIHESARRKIEYISPVVMNFRDYGFFIVLRELFISGLSFAQENPKGAKIGEWLMKNQNHEVYAEMMLTAGPMADAFYTPLFEHAVARGEIRDGLDFAFISHLLTGLNTSMLEYYYQHDGNPSLSDKEKMMEFVDKMIDLIKFGLIKQGGQTHD